MTEPDQPDAGIRIVTDGGAGTDEPSSAIAEEAVSATGLGPAPEADVGPADSATPEPESHESPEPESHESPESPAAPELERETPDDEIAGRLAAIERSMTILAAAGRKQSETIDELHRENVRLRDGDADRILAPALHALLNHLDFIDGIRAGRPTEELTAIRDALLDVLEELGAVHVPTECGETLDRLRHRVAGTVETADPTLERTVAAVARERFDRPDGRILQMALVRVHRAIAPDPDAQGDDAPTGAPVSDIPTTRTTT